MATLKAQVRDSWSQDLATALADADRAQLAALAGEDFREGRDRLRGPSPAQLPRTQRGDASR